MQEDKTSANDDRSGVANIREIGRDAFLSAGAWYYGKVELAEVNKPLAGPARANAVGIQGR